MNILVVDDHPLFRDSAVQMLRTALPGVELRDAPSAEVGLRLATGWADLILLDLTLPGMSGAEAVSAFRRTCPNAKLFVLTASEDHRDIEATLRCGADAYFGKAMSPDQLCQAVLRAIDGERIVAGGATGTGALTHKFSPRQCEILELLCKGLSNKEIALRLNISDTTVKTHVSAIFIGLGVVNRTQAVLAARRYSLVPAAD